MFTKLASVPTHKSSPALVVISYFDINIEGKPLWAHRSTQRLQVYLGIFAGLFVVLALYDAWTVRGSHSSGGSTWPASFFQFGQRIAIPEIPGVAGLPLWVITWFIAVALALKALGTFYAPRRLSLDR